jgi:molybdate transport system substrate-binding protein
MARRSFARAAFAVGVATLALGLYLCGGCANAAEIKILTTTNLLPILESLAGPFQIATGHTLKIDHAGAAPVTRRIQDGELADVVAHSQAAIADLQQQGKLRPGSVIDVARSSVGVAVRSGTPRPEIGSDDDFKRTLLAAASIAYPDPAGGSLGGIYLARYLDEQGLADVLKSRIKLSGPATATGELVASGAAQLGINQIDGLKPVAGIELVFPLPPALTGRIVMSAGVAANAREPEAAAAFLKFLSSPAAAPVIVAHGMEPG